MKGDAPLTDMIGSGRPNPDWSDRNIDGIPGLMLMGEYEWLEGRIDRLTDVRVTAAPCPLRIDRWAAAGRRRNEPEIRA